MYISLDEARLEIRRRWGKVELRQQIQEELGARFWRPLLEKPRALIWPYLLSPDNGFTFFLQCARYLNLDPIAFEFLKDNYVAVNDGKRGLGRLCLYSPSGRFHLKIVDFHLNEKRRISDVVTITGTSLVQFHHDLLSHSGFNIEHMDMSEWVRSIGNGKPVDFYYSFLLHFVGHGVLFEVFQQDEDKRENTFTNQVVIPSVEKIRINYGLEPLIVRLYPEQQDEAEDFYWWCYPTHVNDYIIKYAKAHSLPLRDVVFEQEHRPQPKIDFKKT